MHDPITTDAERIQQIMDMKYSPADLKKIVQECMQLEPEEQGKLLKLLKKCYGPMAHLLRPHKKAKTKNLSTITLGCLHSKHNSFKPRHHKRIKILF